MHANNLVPIVEQCEGIAGKIYAVLRWIANTTYSAGFLGSWIYVSSSFPLVITMNQKSSFTKTPQYVPRTLMSHT